MGCGGDGEVYGEAQELTKFFWFFLFTKRTAYRRGFFWTDCPHPDPLPQVRERGKKGLQRFGNVCIFDFMEITSPRARVGEVAPEMVRRVEMIVSAVAALIARRFLRDPRFMALIVPLWGWLNRTVRRLGRVRVVAVTRVPGVKRELAAGVTRLRLPTGKAWLVKALGWEAAGYGSQLQALMDEPEMVALLAAVPGVVRVLRPLGRMLGVTVGPVVVRMRKARVPKPRVRKVRVKAWSPGPIPDSWWPLKRG